MRNGLGLKMGEVQKFLILQSLLFSMVCTFSSRLGESSRGILFSRATAALVV